MPNFPFEDLEGREVRIRSFLGRPVLILYEDRSTAAWNRALKDRLIAMARRKELPPRLLVLPIVDLRAFRSWPARPIAQSQLQARSRELGKPLWADWSGLAAGALGVSGPGAAVVVLLDGRQRVVWVGSGRLEPREVQELLAALQASGGKEPAASPLRGTRAAGEESPPAAEGSGTSPGGASPGGEPAGIGPEAPASGKAEATGEVAAEAPGTAREESAEGPDEDDEGIPLPPFVTPLVVPLPGRPPAWIPPPM